MGAFDAISDYLRTARRNMVNRGTVYEGSVIERPQPPVTEALSDPGIRETADELGQQFASPVKIVGRGFNPLLRHGSSAEIRAPDLARAGEHGSEMGHGFYTARGPKSLAEEYALNLESETPTVSEYRLKPGEKVFDTGYRASRSDPADVSKVREYLASLGDKQLETTGFKANDLLKLLDHPESPHWIDAANEYAAGQGARSVAMGNEVLTRDPQALQFIRSYIIKDGK